MDYELTEQWPMLMASLSITPISIEFLHCFHSCVLRKAFGCVMTTLGLKY